MEPFETFVHAGFTVELHQDEDPSAPSEWDQLGELVAFDPLWREYRFAERNTTDQEDAALERGGLELLARYLRVTQGATIVPFTFHDYGSGGQALRAVDLSSDRTAGFIVATPERARKLGIPEVEGEAERQLRGELDEWAAYVAGEVVGYVVRDDKGDAVDSCWGFYPDGEGDGLGFVRLEARIAAENERDARAKRWAAVRAGWAVAHAGAVMPV